jgi:subtilisin family serine protease
VRKSARRGAELVEKETVYVTTHTPRGRRVAAVLVGAATAVAGAAAVTAPAASAEPLPYQDGSYIVLMDDPALASYTGGIAGLDATKPAAGESVDLTGAAAQEYVDYLVDAQADLLAAVGADATYTYQVAFNGFAAELDSAEATTLAGLPGVTAVLPNEVRSIDTVATPDLLGLTGPDGVWADLGGADAAGKGVVVGVLDTGVWPENASFAGDRLRQGRAPRTDGKGRVVGRNPLMGRPFLTPEDEVVMLKADGTVFRGECELGEAWTTTDLCNDKLITARSFSASFEAALAAGAKPGPFEFLSARDGNGHGSHTASTAVGNGGVPMSVAGTDLGEGSGMAPAAKLAVYKVCWQGSTAATTGCYTADAVEAIEQSVLDGVDVLNYSISGATTTVVDAVEIAFYHAANAGVFVAASAGNSGPGASTVAHNSPWVTTVAATTFKREEATVLLGNGARYLGASVARAALPQAAVVLSTSAVLDGATAEAARLCTPGTLDPAVVTGTIVVCDRGEIPRVDKSAAVAQAGGVAMILTNTTPGSLDPDYHVVPTVHVDEAAGAAIKAYVSSTPAPTAGIQPGNTTGSEPTPIPQAAGFSSRGPALSSGSDLIKPDISAPGVAVVAAYAPGAAGTDNSYTAISGTSMASPHVAGLAALVLGKHPTWHPSVVKSAMMTTAFNLKAADGSDVTDPFVQGSGFVNPGSMFAPGLVLEADEEDWGGFYAGQGLPLAEEFAVVEPTDLNYPSIGISQQAGPQTVTRTFRALQAGTWTIEADVPGYEVTTSVATVTGNRKGTRSTSVDFTFTRTDAPLALWANGFITLTGPTTVRMPVALRPVSVAAPAEVSAPVEAGSVEVGITAGFTGELDLTTQGLAQGVVAATSLPAQTPCAPGRWCRKAPRSCASTWTPVNNGADLDLTVYRLNAAGVRVALAGQSATGAADERVDLLAPVPATYEAVLENYANAPVRPPRRWSTRPMSCRPRPRSVASPRPLTRCR